MNPQTTGLAKRLGNVYRRDGRSAWVNVAPEKLMDALAEIRKSTERISNISVYDAGSMLEVMYSFIVNNDQLMVKTAIPAAKPELHTCTGMFPGALLLEREQHEMFGVAFEGHPNMERLLYAASTPKTPLRKPGKK